MKTSTAVTLLYLINHCYLSRCHATVHASRETTFVCPNGSSLCLYLAGAGCVNSTAGDTCCVDGSGILFFLACSTLSAKNSSLGICSGGLQCGTGVALSRCCEVVSAQNEEKPTLSACKASVSQCEGNYSDSVCAGYTRRHRNNGSVPDHESPVATNSRWVQQL